jgi:hypothetical protein
MTGSRFGAQSRQSVATTVSSGSSVHRPMQARPGCFLRARWFGAKRRPFRAVPKGSSPARGWANAHVRHSWLRFLPEAFRIELPTPRAVVTQVLSDATKFVTMNSTCQPSWRLVSGGRARRHDLVSIRAAEGTSQRSTLQAMLYNGPEKARSAAARSKKSSILTIRPSRIVSRL